MDNVDMEVIIRIARDHAGQLRDTVGSAIWEICDEIERLTHLLDKLNYYIEHSSTCATNFGKLRNCDCGLDEVYHG
jgi:hypothetical protein